MRVDRLNTLKLRLNFCDKASCWFKRRLSVVKRFKNAGALVFPLGSYWDDCWVDRLRTLNFRLNFCDRASCWFKRRLSVVKRFKNAGALVLPLGSYWGDCWLDRLRTLNFRLNFCDRASCWFKRRLSVVKRFKNAGALVFRLGSCRSDCWVDRLSTLKSRLTFLDTASCWFKRLLSVVKRYENTSVSALRNKFLKDVALPFDGFGRSEIYQISNGSFRHMHIVEKLLFVLGKYSFNRFQFRDDGSVNNEVRNIAFFQFPPLVVDFQGMPCGKRNALVGQFDLQALLVDFFAHPRTHFFVNLKNCSHESVTFIAKILSVFSHSIKCDSLYFVRRINFDFSSFRERVSVLRLETYWGDCWVDRLRTLNFRLNFFYVVKASSAVNGFLAC